MLVGILVPSDGTRQKAFSEGMERSTIGITDGDLLGRIKGPIGQVCFSGQAGRRSYCPAGSGDGGSYDLFVP